MRFHAVLITLVFALASCAPAPAPVPPAPPIPAPPEPPQPPPPTPTPNVDEIARAKWDAVAPGMTEAEVVALVGPSKHRAVVGPGFLALGYYVRIDGVTHYVEIVFDAAGRVSHKTTW